jgi:hypothetical protein
MMNKMPSLRLRLGLVVVGAVMYATCVWAASFNPSSYPGRYSSNGTALTSDVIVGPTATASRGGSTGVTKTLLVGCEVYNGNAAVRTIFFYDSPTVPADGTPAFKVFMVCGATSWCTWGNNGPNMPQGGAGVVFTNGLSWANSSTIPSKTLGSADSTVACSFQQ